VTRHLLEQTRRNGEDIAEIKSDVKGLTRRVDGLDRKVDALDRKVDGLDRKVGGLARSLPEIVGEAVRDAFREERERKR
jgi:predicted RNase H-like nuclease (RuvC/YqgF family)